MTFQKFAFALLLSGILGVANNAANRLEKIEDQVTQIRVDVAALKSREVAAVRPELK